MIQLNHGYTVFFTSHLAGESSAADSTPTAVLYRNGSASGVAVTVSTTAQTGVYKATFTTDSGWDKTDVLHLIVTATIDSKTDNELIWDSTGDVDAVMRGTDNASTFAAGGNVNVASIDVDAINADSVAAAAVTKIQSGLATSSALTTVGANVLLILDDTGTTIPGLIDAINQSASRRITLATSTAMEIPDSGSFDYQIEMRTFDGDGDLVAADSTPTLAVTGGASGDLAADLSAASNPSTGIYRWTLTVASDATVEQIWLDGSATISSATFTARTFSYIADAVAVDFAAADRTKLQAIYDKLPSASYLLGGASSDGSGYATQTSVDDLPTNSEFAAALPTNFDTLAINASGHISRVTLVDTTTTNTDMRGTNGAFTGSVSDIRTEIDNNSTKLASIVNRLGAWTGTGVNTVLGAFKALLSKAASVPSDIGGTFDAATDSTEAVREAIDGIDVGSGLTGPYTVTITVSDGTDGIEGATVRMYRSGATQTKTANADGEVEFTVTANTWSVAIVANGFVGQTNSLTVSADASQSYTLTAATVTTPDSPTLSTGVALALDKYGAAESGVRLSVNLVTPPSGSGKVYDTGVWTETTGDDGTAEFVGMVRGAVYRYWRGASSNDYVSVTVPDSESFNMPTLTGNE